jgi:lipopolysaccharide biosynthesis glycosyltransferase
VSDVGLGQQDDLLRVADVVALRRRPRNAVHDADCRRSGGGDHVRIPPDRTEAIAGQPGCGQSSTGVVTLSQIPRDPGRQLKRIAPRLRERYRAIRGWSQARELRWQQGTGLFGGTSQSGRVMGSITGTVLSKMPRPQAQQCNQETPDKLVTTIILAADESYLPYVPCNIAQIGRFGSRADGVVLAVPTGVDEELIAMARSTAAAHGLELKVSFVSALEPLHKYRAISNVNHVSYFTYSKLVLAEILPEIDDVLYLDIDTLIRAPLDELLAWKLHHPVGAVHDWATGVHLFGTPRRPYFNAGVLRLSLTRMRQEQTWRKAQRIFQTRDLKIVDQDVFNLLFGDRFDSLPPTYNVFDSLVSQSRGIRVFQDPVIVHFAGPDKPWHLSARSPFAREWRRCYSEVGRILHTDPATSSNRPSVYGQARKAGKGRLGSAARAVLPVRAKRAARQAVDAAADRALCRLEEIKAAENSRPIPSIYPISAAKVDIEERREVESREARHEAGLDLLISVARSGTNAFGNVIQHSRPQVHWLNELYLGLSEGLREGELLDQFPWFSNGDPNSRAAMKPRERDNATRSLSAAMSENAVAVTRSVLKSRTGRTLIKVFPDQLDPAAFEEVLRIFRPRLLILRRELVFSYISLLRASRTGSWWDADLTDVPFNVTDRAALQYAVRTDGWFDYVAQLAAKLRLESVCFTYSGLFDTGAEIALLESLYPGPSLSTDAAGRLRSGLGVQDRRSDASVLDMLQGVSRLSSTAQSHLLRLPGNYLHLLGDANAKDTYASDG